MQRPDIIDTVPVSKFRSANKNCSPLFFPYKITSVAARVHQHPGGNYFAQRVLSDFSGGTAWTQLGQVLAQNGP